MYPGAAQHLRKVNGEFQIPDDTAGSTAAAGAATGVATGGATGGAAAGGGGSGGGGVLKGLRTPNLTRVRVLRCVHSCAWAERT